MKNGRFVLTSLSHNLSLIFHTNTVPLAANLSSEAHWIQNEIGGYFTQQTLLVTFEPNGHNVITPFSRFKQIQAQVITFSLVRERLGLRDRDLGEPLRPPEFPHPLGLSHLGIMGEHIRVLGTFGSSECCERGAIHHRSQHKVSQSHRVRDQIPRRTRRKVRLDVVQAAPQAFYLLV